MSDNPWLFRVRYLAEIFLKKKKKAGGGEQWLTITNFETYYKAIVIETVLYC